MNGNEAKKRALFKFIEKNVLLRFVNNHEQDQFKKSFIISIKFICCMKLMFYLSIFSGGDKHIDSSSDSDMDMPSMMGNSSNANQSSSKISHGNMSGSLSQNLLLQQQSINSHIGK